MKNIKIKYHFYFWTFDFLTHCYLHYSAYATKITILATFLIFIRVVLKIFFVYSVILTNSLKNENYVKIILYVFSWLILYSIFSILIINPFGEIEGDDSGENTISLISFSTEFFFLTYTVLPIAFAFYYIDQNIAIAKEQRAIEHQNNLLEQSIIKEKLSGLRMQINPAFLERTLAYFYRESLPYSPNLSKGITLLSDMMKYALNEDDKEGKVPLENEIKHIRNFIEIQQLRFDNRLQVNFGVSGEIQNKSIIPLLLITFIENSFKYGELHDAKHSLSIKLSVVDDTLFFKTHNWKRRGPKEESEGIGIVNTQRRLTLAYPNKHHLSIHDNLDDYEVDLSLILS